MKYLVLLGNISKFYEATLIELKNKFLNMLCKKLEFKS